MIRSLVILVFLSLTSLFADVILDSKNQNIELLNVEYYEDKKES